MEKQELIKKLTGYMDVICNAYWKGKLHGRLPRIHERANNTTDISIDLYHFEGDGKPVCDGLRPCVITREDGSTHTGWVFNMCYEPGEEQQLVFLFEPESDDDEMPVDDCEVNPECLPEEALQNIITWLHEEVEQTTVEDLLKESNPVTSFFYYMWNKWCEEECRLVFNNDPHFWNKWCGIYDKYSRFGKVEEFYAELSDTNRDKLLRRATEVYDGRRQRT